MLLGPMYVNVEGRLPTSTRRGKESSPVSEGLEQKKKKADLYLGIRDSLGTAIKIIVTEEKE